MHRLFKNLACLALFTLAGQVSWGFALLGPINEAYQVTTIGYGLGGDIGAPKNLGEEYRRNTPVMYYSFDANFLDYFGSNGVYAVEQAMVILNSVTNASKLSPNLTEYPLQATRENYVAEALGLSDLKTWALKAMVEQLGLGEPERYAWTLHDRVQIPGFPLPCPSGFVYNIIQRNFDPVPSPAGTYQSTAYVNGTLYSYWIAEACQTPDPVAVTVPFPVDPLDFTYTAVASLFDTMIGRFHTSLTRDDVGGLRYLISPRNYNFESAGTNSLVEVTNPVPQLLFTSNLTLLADLALTNDPVTLSTLVPNLNIITSSNYFVNAFVTNITPYFTNYPWDPANTGGHLVFATNITPVVQIRYQNTYGNLLKVVPGPNGWTVVPLNTIPPATNRVYVTIETDVVGTGGSPWNPPGTTNIFTNSFFTTYITNAVGGDYLVLPTNICSVYILASQLTNVVTASNLVSVAINGTVTTNVNGFTNIIVTSAITYETNHAFVVLQANCVPSGAALFGGIDRFHFIRRDYDSLLGRFFAPITNTYSLNSITNNTLVPQKIQRTIAFPDFLFSAQDLAPGPAVYPPGNAILARTNNWNATLANNNLAGPGTIEPPSAIVFDKVGVIFGNTYLTAFRPDTAQPGQVQLQMLGSFDGTTNAPIVYPNGTDIVNVENMMLIGILPGSLPNGKVNAGYGPVQFTATGGQGPYTWGLAQDSPALPPGLHLSSSGALSGIPAQEGTFDFTIMLTDAGGRTVVRGYSLTISF